MGVIQQWKYKPWFLFFSGILLMTGAVFQILPVFCFVALVPLFALVDLPWKPRDVYICLGLGMAGMLFTIFLRDSGPLVALAFYMFLLGTLLSAYITAQRLTQNRLNKFSLIILWMGAEFVVLTFFAHGNPPFLADLSDNPTWTRWNTYTGYLGVSFWILAVNLLVYQAAFGTGRAAGYLFTFIALLSVALPVVYSLNITHLAFTKADALDFYRGNDPLNAHYSGRGELISRTGAWVSVLIIIFTLIRMKTKKTAR